MSLEVCMHGCKCCRHIWNHWFCGGGQLAVQLLCTPLELAAAVPHYLFLIVSRLSLLLLLMFMSICIVVLFAVSRPVLHTIP
jgi:hypothetical protein